MRRGSSARAFFTHSRSVCTVQPILAERSSPIATDDLVRDPVQVAPRGDGPQARTCCLSACSRKPGAVQVTGKIRLVVVP